MIFMTETEMKVQIFPQYKMNVLNVRIKTVSYFVATAIICEGLV